MSKKTKQYLILLDNMDIVELHKMYSLELPVEITDYGVQATSVTTKLKDLNPNKNIPEAISFLDESKRSHVCKVSMIDFQSKMDVNLLRYHCFWCKNPFSTKPIGIPIKYVPNQVVKKYHSHISKDTYTIKENIGVDGCRDISGSEQLSLKRGDYYETDGVVCSWNCNMAFINDNKHNPLYANSAVLVIKMHNDFMGTKCVVITPAPHWRMLEQYGGSLSIVKFRDGFGKIDYECHGLTRVMPKFLAIATLFEEKLRF